MSQTALAIANLPPASASQTRDKAQSQPLNDEADGFASLVGAEKAAKPTLPAKKHRQQSEASSSGEADDAHLASSQALNDPAVNSPGDLPNQAPFIIPAVPSVSWATFGATSSLGSDFTPTASSASADFSLPQADGSIQAADVTTAASSTFPAAPASGQTKAADPIVAVKVQTHFSPEDWAPAAIAGATAAPEDPIEAPSLTSSTSSSATTLRRETLPLPAGQSPRAAQPDEAPQPVTFARLATQSQSEPALAAAASQAAPAESAADGSSSAAPRSQDSTATSLAAPDRVVSAPKASASNSGSSFQDESSADASPRRDQNTGSEITSAATAGLSGSGPLTFAADGVSSQSVSRQIATGIQRAFPSETSRSLADARSSAFDGQQPLQTITITLSPANLGTVDVELSLKSGQLAVKLHVQEGATAQLLRQDGSLEKLLESAGYAVKSLSVHLSQSVQATEQATANGPSFSNTFSSSTGGNQHEQQQYQKGRSPDRDADRRPEYGRIEKSGGDDSLYV